MFANIFETTKHSWYLKHGHLHRGKSRTVRCQIGKMSIDQDYQLSVELTFKEKGKSCKKKVSPSTINCMHILWLNRDIVSEEEEENLVQDFKLPTLQLDKSIYLTSVQKRIIEFGIRQSHILEGVL